MYSVVKMHGSIKDRNLREVIFLLEFESQAQKLSVTLCKKSGRQNVAPWITVPLAAPAKNNLSPAPARVTLNSQTSNSNDADDDDAMMTWSSADEGTLNVGDRTFMVP